MDFNLKNKVALVTGGSHGLGKAICMSLASEGVNVAINYRSSPEKAAAVAAEIIKKHHIQAICVQGDIGIESDVTRIFEQTLRQFNKIDLLINNAGVCPVSMVKDMSLTEWENVMRTNLTGTFLTSRAMINVLIDAKRPGKIINIASQSAFNGSKTGKSHYAASKGGIVTFTHSLAKEVAQYGISVNAVAPGMMYTEMTAETLSKNLAQYQKEIPLGRVATVDEVARVVTFLASNFSDYMTGTTIDVSGGMVGR